jgi:hypothetical protein
MHEIDGIGGYLRYFANPPIFSDMWGETGYLKISTDT